MPDVLENPAYHALAGAHAALAERRGRAVRYAASVAPFGALPPDAAPADWDDLRTLAHPTVSLMAPGEIPPGWTVARELQLVQMALERPLDTPAAPPGEELSPADVEAMLALVGQTNPGPFERRTIELGRYVGVRDGGRLVA